MKPNSFDRPLVEAYNKVIGDQQLQEASLKDIGRYGKMAGAAALAHFGGSTGQSQTAGDAPPRQSQVQQVQRKNNVQQLKDTFLQDPSNSKGLQYLKYADYMDIEDVPHLKATLQKAISFYYKNIKGQTDPEDLIQFLTGIGFSRKIAEMYAHGA